MDQKVGKITGPGAVIRVGQLSRLLEDSLSPVFRREIVYYLICPPKTNSDFLLSTLDTALENRSVMVFAKVWQYRREPHGNAPVANFAVAAGHVREAPFLLKGIE
jgi:hypothetical protein